jgi:hypothetical protein
MGFAFSSQSQGALLAREREQACVAGEILIINAEQTFFVK